MTVKTEGCEFLKFASAKVEMDAKLLLDFKETCARLGVKQAVLIRQLIRDFVDEAKDK